MSSADDLDEWYRQRQETIRLAVEWERGKTSRRAWEQTASFVAVRAHAALRRRGEEIPLEEVMVEAVRQVDGHLDIDHIKYGAPPETP